MSGFPQRFGRYELLERIAVGGMAEIFRARVRGAEGFEKIVVIKRLLPHMAADPKFNAMFIDEAKMTARLVHPKIAQTYELGRHDEQLYIAMEYVDGIDALALLRECAQRSRRVPPGICVHIVQNVLDALDFAHHQIDADGRPMGVIHRDISPSNVLMSRRGDIKLIDFGIARAVERAHQTKAGTLKGKYGYMSPEQVLGDGLDARSDLFAVGVVLSELLTGRRLFAARNELDVLLMVRDARLERLEQFGRHIDAALMQILHKALHKDRGQRYQSAAAMREALDDWMFTARERVTIRDMAALVNDFYDAAVVRRRKHVESAAELVTSVSPAEVQARPTAGDGGGEPPSQADDPGLVDGIPIGRARADSEPPSQADDPGLVNGIPIGRARADSEPPIMIDGPGSSPGADSDDLELLVDEVDLADSELCEIEELELPELDASAEPPPGDIGRALDLQLAEAAAHAQSPAAWSQLARITPRPVSAASLRSGDDAPVAGDAVPQAVPVGPQSPERSVRYPSIEDAIAAASQREPDPSTLDFDDSEVAPGESSRSARTRLPTAEELAHQPAPAPPALADLDGEPARAGDLAVEPPIGVLAQLIAERATGQLVVTVGGIRKDIYLVEGAPEFVSSNLAKELFGEYLVGEGVLSQGELAMALAMMPHYSGKLGDTLVGLGLMKPLEVFRMLTRQVRSKLVNVCTWGKGEYRWYPGRENPREAFPLDLQPYEVLGAGAAAIPEAIVATWAGANAQARPRSQKADRVRPEDFQLGGDLRRIYDSLDGTKSLAELRSRYTDEAERFRFLRILYLYVNTGLAAL